MRKKLLIVVDYQVDFVNGALGFKKAETIEANIVDKIESYRALGNAGEVIFTLDTHAENYLESQEGINLPVPHCIRNTDGWQIYGKVKELKKEEDKVFIKPGFASLELANYLKDGDYESVELCGLVTNICVIANMVMVKAALPEVPILVDRKAVSSYDEELENKSVDIMANLHCKII